MIVVATLGGLTAHHARPDSLDARIDAAIIARLASHPQVVGHLIELGNTRPATVICVVLVLGCLALRRPRGAVLITVAVPVAIVITEYLLKPLFARKLGDWLVFPSGHETVVSAMAFALILVLTGPARPALPAALRWLLAAVALAATIALAPALITAHYHYFTDTIGGAAIGLGTVLATALTLDAVLARLARARAGDAGPAPAAGEMAAADGMTAAARRLPPA
ncbi:MAG TPA: phosphatase PAP2 family protein [Streptosporangiaceae bacterium]|nr:phosphatase PAP2 family protein [Streptosporangiaceae bacterium]